MKIQISDIHVGDRHRRDLGDLDSLAGSISRQGLLQPVGLTEDKVLVFGERRLTACRDILGWEEIDARIVNVTSIVEGEHDENEVRKDFTVSERVAIAEAVERMLGERRGRPEENTDNCPELPRGETRDLAANAAGFNTGKTYERAKSVIMAAVPELVGMMDDEEISISAAAAIAKQPQDAQAEIIKLDPARRKDVVADIRKGASYSLGDDELKRKMQPDIVEKVQSISIGFEMADEAHMTASEFCRDALPMTISELAVRAPRLIYFLQAVLKEASHDKQAAR